MRTVRDLREMKEARGKGTAVAIGKFDGVHRGHQKLLRKLVEAAGRRELVSVAFTFDPPPAVLFGGADAAPLLALSEQRAMLERLGVDILVEFPFDRETAAMPPERFLERILSQGLGAKLIVCGDDVSFGDGGRGDLALLQRCSGDLGYEVMVVEKLKEDGIPISSTRIRRAIAEGRMDEARALLGKWE